MQARTQCPRCGGRHIMYHKNPDKPTGWMQQCHDCFKTWPAPVPDVFMGTAMKCILCDKELVSDPNVESNWTCFELDDKSRYYTCPDCLQQNAGSIEERYKLAFEKIAALRGGTV